MAGGSTTAGRMKLVVDTSVAVKWLVRENGTESARAVLAIPDSLIAPNWLLVEAANTFWKNVKRSELLKVHAVRHIEDMPAFFETLHDATDLIAPALNLSFRLRHPVYDCLFIALAIREEARLVTADEGMAEAAERGALQGKVELLA